VRGARRRFRRRRPTRLLLTGAEAVRDATDTAVGVVDRMRRDGTLGALDPEDATCRG
jgi:hypothetical protein